MSRMRKYRRVKGMTLKEVAKYLGVTVGCVSQYETGLRGTPIPVAKKLGKLYGCPWPDFYEDEGDGQTAIG